MLRRYLEFAARPGVLAVSLAVSTLFTLVVFPALPLGAPLIDLMPGYSLVDIENRMRELGPEGRRVHAWATPTLDTLFPLAYATLFAGLLYRFRPANEWWIAALLPVFAGVWDLAENAQILAMLVRYPALSSPQVAAASFFTQVKHLLSAGYLVLSAALLARAAWHGVRQRLVRPPP